MKIKELEERIDLFSLIANDYPTKKVGDHTYRINPCPICGHKDHFTFYPKTNSYSSFNACCQGGSVYKYLQEVKGMSQDQAFKKLYHLAGGKANNEPDSKPVTKPNATAIIAAYIKNQTQEDLTYFFNRGFSREIIEQYQLCLGDVNRLHYRYFGKRAIIPIIENGKVVDWNSRCLSDTQGIKYLKAPRTASDKIVYFNTKHLTQAKPLTKIVLTEGEFDALCLEMIGVPAVALRSIKNIKLFLATARKDLIYVTGFDNEEQAQLASEKNRLVIPILYGDLNEWFVGDPEGFETSIKDQLENMPMSNQNKTEQINEPVEKKVGIDVLSNQMDNYLKTAWSNEVGDYLTGSKRGTGFKALDKELGGLYPGLYILGAASSMGKTTYYYQIAEQMASAGEHVLFFSLEQNQMEMMMKSIRRMYPQATSEWDQQQWSSAGLSVAKKIGNRLSVIPYSASASVGWIERYITEYIHITGIKPIVIVDYVQIIPHAMGRSSDKERTDGVVRSLKNFQRDHQLVVMAISSINRSHYLSPITFESFKESGGIEYAADFLWGLQPSCMNEALFFQPNRLEEKRERIGREKLKTVRKMELVCLKNRNGKITQPLTYDYDAAHDTFNEMAAIHRIDQFDNGDPHYVKKRARI